MLEILFFSIDERLFFSIESIDRKCKKRLFFSIERIDRKYKKNSLSSILKNSISKIDSIGFFH